MKTSFAWPLLPLTALVLSACSTGPSSADLDKMAADMTKASFQDRGIAKLDRLEQDQANAACAQPSKKPR